MDWLTIIGLIALGTFLLIAEIIFVPGTTLVGILGFVLSVFGIYLGYEYFGRTTGTIIMILTITVNTFALILAFKGQSWERFSLKNINQSHFNDDFKVQLQVGDHGKTISSLKPIGKALFKDKEVEVRSNGSYINENIEVEVFRIEPNKIFVKPINN